MIPQRRFPWIAEQNWQNILFIHTPVSYSHLRKVVPEPFAIDTYNGMGWMSIVLFRATNSRPRFMPTWLSYPPFHQMNIRTYVQFGEERGVYFFSINTDHRIVKWGGNLAAMPFRKAPMIIRTEKDTFEFTGRGLPADHQGNFQVVYKPDSLTFKPRTSSLDYFLTERYCIWMVRGNTIVKAPIQHTHWTLQDARISIKQKSNIAFPITDDTIAHYSPYKRARIHPFERIGKISTP